MFLARNVNTSPMPCRMNLYAIVRTRYTIKNEDVPQAKETLFSVTPLLCTNTGQLVNHEVIINIILGTAYIELMVMKYVGYQSYISIVNDHC